MLNELLSATAAKLRENFNGKAGIYTSPPQAEPERPYLLAEFSHVREVPMVGRRLRRDYGLRIQYYPSGSEDRAKAYEAMDLLMNHMDGLVLEDGSRVNGFGMNWRTEEGIMTFYADYRLSLIKIPEGEEHPMEAVRITGACGNGK